MWRANSLSLCLGRARAVLESVSEADNHASTSQTCCTVDILFASAAIRVMQM